MAKGTQTNPAALPGAVSSGVYNSTPLSLNNGDQLAHQLDSEGNLKVAVANATSIVTSSELTEWGSQAVTAATNTAPTGAEYAPVFRSLDFKSTSTVVNGAVGPGVLQYSAWQDSQATGAMYAETTAVVVLPPISFVQYATASGSTSWSATLNGITQGNMLVWFSMQWQSAATPTDTQGNLWLAAETLGNGSYGVHAYYCIAKASGSDTVTQTGNYGGGIFMEIAGVDTLDVKSAATNTGTAVSSGSISTSYPAEIILNLFQQSSGSLTETPTDGATPIVTNLAISSSTLNASYEITTATGTHVASGTASGSVEWVAYCIGFYNSAANISGISIGIQESDDQTYITTPYAAPVTTASEAFTAQGTVAKRYYRSYFQNGLGTVDVAQTLTSSSETPELLDLSGNQKFIFGTQFQVGTSWSSATSVGAAQTIISDSGVPCVVVQLNQSSGTFTAGAVTFQGTRDGTNWETIPGDILFDPKTLTAAPNPYTLVSSTNKAFLIQTTGYVAIRLGLSTAITGTGTVTPYINTTSYDPLPLNSGIYNSTIPTLTDGQAGALQLDVHGNQCISSPSAFHAVQATASGSTAVWTPASGKKFRLQQFRIQVTGNATLSSAGVLTISLLDGSSDLSLDHDIYVPATAFSVGDDYDSGWVDLGTGLQSAAANNVLNIGLSAALTAGNVRVIAGGLEE